MTATEYTDCITFTGESSDFTLAIGSNGAKEWDGTVEYSTDHNTWTVWNGTAVSSANKKLYLRGSGNTKFFTSKGARLSLSARAACSGNIQTLLEYSNPPTSIPADYCYYYMFRGCTGLTAAPTLPATTLRVSCYNRMFEGCTSLTKAPDLPATTMTNGCYQYMFNGCTSLTTAPDLPATTLANYCYANMFYGCTNLRISSTQSAEYPTAWRIPSSGTVSSAARNWNADMLTGTGGTFAGTPGFNRTYYGAWTSQETDTSKKFTKLKYKASDFCQLMDKSKYPATSEIAGITFTNNGDGSFTMSGTKNGNAQMEICTTDIKKGHKYLGTTGTDTFYMWFYKEGSSVGGDFIRSPFYTATETDTDIRFFIKTDSTDEVNVTAYPQLFDLTEMYGAGNEPTTLAEFRQKYPNDLYPYSPQCWYSINKTRYITPTKNLFNINNGFIRQIRCNGVIENGVATITATAVNANYCFAKVDVEVGKTYIVSANWTTTGYSLGLMVSNESSYDTSSYGYITETINSIKIVATGTELYLKGYVTYDVLPAVATIHNIQVEENSVKTDYVPYGYLPLNKGVKI